MLANPFFAQQRLADRNRVPSFVRSPHSCIPVGGKAVNGVIAFFMALLSFRGISTPSLPVQGEQRRSSYFNIPPGQFHEITTADPHRT
jgi:hypothetical protein